MQEKTTTTSHRLSDSTILLRNISADFWLWCNEANRVLFASLLRFLDYTHTHTHTHTHKHTHTHIHTLSRTPLNEWSARRRGRYLHNTQQTLCPQRDSNPRPQQSSGCRPITPDGHRHQLSYWIRRRVFSQRTNKFVVCSINTCWFFVRRIPGLGFVRIFRHSHLACS